MYLMVDNYYLVLFSVTYHYMDNAELSIEFNYNTYNMIVLFLLCFLVYLNNHLQHTVALKPVLPSWSVPVSDTHTIVVSTLCFELLWLQLLPVICFLCPQSCFLNKVIQGLASSLVSLLRLGRRICCWGRK